MRTFLAAANSSGEGFMAWCERRVGILMVPAGSIVSALLLLILVLNSSHAFSFTASDCVGEGGSKLCSAPRPTAWTYNLCDNAAAYTQRWRAWCEARGGTYLHPSCSGATPDGESNLVDRAEGFASRISNQTNCSAIDSGWGQTIDAYQCWAGSPSYQNGLLIRDFRLLDVSNCGEDIFARKDRQLVCSPGAIEHMLGNRKICVKNQEFSECPSVGNPILPLTGKKIQRELDFGDIALSLTRIYSSDPWFVPHNVVGNLPEFYGQFGDSWRTNFSYRLFLLNGSLSGYAISFPNGAVEYFSPQLEQNTHLYKSGFLYRSGTDFIYRVDDLQLVFSGEGYLKKYSRQGEQEYLLTYSGLDYPNPILSVLPNGRQGTAAVPAGLLINIGLENGGSVYQFSYDASGRVVFIEGGLKKLFYEYGVSGNLIRVSDANGIARRYLYESLELRHLLTGITDEEGVRFATWTYDDNGRAISSSHASGLEAVSVDFSQADSATDPHISVTNSLGKATTFRYGLYQGVRKVKNIEGHASDNCAAANKSYDYYPNGTLKSKTDWSGNIITYERDQYGREISRTEASGTPQARTVLTEYHPTLNQPVKITEPGLITEMAYDTDGRLLNTKKTATAQ